MGQISKTMGYYTIELKENTTLPVFLKMYYLSPGETQQMRDSLRNRLQNGPHAAQAQPSWSTYISERK